MTPLLGAALLVADNPAKKMHKYIYTYSINQRNGKYLTNINNYPRVDLAFWDIYQLSRSVL